MESFNFSPIGIFKSPYKNKYDAPRQSVENTRDVLGEVKLSKGHNLEQGLKGLGDFERIWLIYQFHENQKWRPLTQTPRATEKQGVFATRAPYRPNPIGISCVKLVKIEGASIWVKEFDLLDETPILDIKPYIPSCDQFQVENTSWVEEENKKEVQFSDVADKQMLWLEEQGVKEMRGAIVDQLSRDPVNSKKKRVILVENNIYELSYRTWRIVFEFQNEEPLCRITKLYSGYSVEDMKSGEDTYKDKLLHAEFGKMFG